MYLNGGILAYSPRVEIWTETAAGKERYFFDGENLEIDRGKGVKTIPITDVKSVMCVAFANMRVCELRLRDGVKQALSVDKPSPEFKRFIEALHVKLADAGGVTFQRGSWLAIVTLALIGTLMIVFGALLYTKAIVVSPMLNGKALVIMLAGVASALFGPLLVWRTRPRPYDPRAPLDVLA